MNNVLIMLFRFAFNLCFPTFFPPGNAFLEQE